LAGLLLLGFGLASKRRNPARCLSPRDPSSAPYR